MLRSEAPMAATCPYCRETGLPDGAVKCRACGSWLDPARATDAAEAFRRELRADVQADLKGHRESLMGMLTQLKWVAGIIVAAGLAAAVYFGVRTDQSISDTAARIAAEAEAQIKTASTEIADQTRVRMTKAISDRIDAPETTEMIETTMRAALAEKVAAEVALRSQDIAVQVEGQIDAAKAELAAVLTEIDGMEERSRAALGRLDSIEASFTETRAQTVDTSRSVLPVDAVQIEGKGDVGHLRDLMGRVLPVEPLSVGARGGVEGIAPLMRERIDSLSFQIGNFYYGPVVWKYFDRLRLVPEFRFVVLYDQTGGFLALLDAAALAAALDPPDAAALGRELAAIEALPDEARVPGWTAFARAVSEGDTGWLAGLPSFIGAGDAVRSDATSLGALDQMDRLRRDVLPVIGPDGRFQGVLDRSRLTTRVLLELAGGAP
jgi:hypothetical protein